MKKTYQEPILEVVHIEAEIILGPSPDGTIDDGMYGDDGWEG